jgi:hypothetical protein
MVKKKGEDQLKLFNDACWAEKKEEKENLCILVEVGWKLKTIGLLLQMHKDERYTSHTHFSQLLKFWKIKSGG